MSESLLTPQEWSNFRALRGEVGSANAAARMLMLNPDPGKGMAALNDALLDADPRKITRAKLKALRAAARKLGPGGAGIAAFADALEGYLPPG